ncbi:12156_t:CDS:2 [Funneliformis mosseae]|uniref:12156_t:CDS:1 n=1 Tax=Funneliformis mosseae TaxID=27381 RepID=A0A9N9B113_FUNMO|nr:12156_t:CDS:2 [Funneliformis mosseae]
MTDIDETLQQKSSSEDEEEEHVIKSGGHFDPQRWPYLKKFRILFLISLPTFLTPLSHVFLYPAMLEIKRDFNTTAEFVNLLFVIFFIFQGSTELIIFRALQSLGISASFSLGGGTISDLFIPSERGRAYAVYLIGYFVAFATGPFIGELITQLLGWRWIFYVLAISGGVILLLLASFLPETFRPSEGSLRSIKPHKVQIVRVENPISPSEESTSFIQRKRYNPLSPLKLLLQLNITLAILSKSVTFSIIYIQSILIIEEFSSFYDLSNLTIVLTYMSPTVGYLIGNFITGKYSDVLIKHESDDTQVIKEDKPVFKFPVMRIKVAYYSSLLVPFFIASLGWLLRNRVHVAIPLISTFIAGIGLQSQCNGVSTYLIDACPGKSASALALSEFFSYLLVVIVILLIRPLEVLVLLGIGWTVSIMALFSFLSIIFLFIVLGFDARWRGVNTL